jgi:hypothetical protein
VPLAGAKIVPGHDMQPQHLLHYNGKIVECCWDFDNHAWVFHRERTDKDTPNAYHVYESVFK